MTDYVPPTAADLKARFPEMTPVSDALVSLILTNEAIPAVGDTWLSKDRFNATLYLAAHLLASEGEPGRTVGGGTTTNGPIKSEQAGDHKIEYAVSEVATAAQIDGGFETTVYGNRYLRLLRLNFPAALVV